ncbi:AAA family ATPase [Candidatus Nephthysia bennettiae]|uniref:Chromosome partition protein Smc n=1 Tax=Candidatus Nephthysia bennettiae TaxID=3127016 RepID=A0A934KD59_9BACT|nr:AAA family ATPase [Candidatus Dormibacteraeota bacterium]MBJ7611116.1 AAA family ATPase [Candidatus Dormibacteraeota bacterium]
MQLRSITLAGFKTFARQTEIGFDPGVTAIVGPNGSGKSNIVDSFKWVLGETQARDLRGRRMEEVIYAGGERRARAAVADVSILIDNSDHRLPVDYEEVSIRRRVDRTGQSDYFLNGSRVRRRDLMQLLASTGLTTDSYAMVDQRDIESIISCTPEQRRLLIEEAAQVRGVKAKRREAATQLEDLARNLLRLEDLRGEIEPRLESVRAQAAAAREADAARRRLEVLRGSLVWEEWREARDAHRRASSQVQSLERRVAESAQASAAAEEEFRKRRQELQSAQDRRLNRQRAIGAHRLDLTRAQHELALAEERGRNQAAMAAAAHVEEGELVARGETAAALRRQLQTELETVEHELQAVPEPPPEPARGDPQQARAARAAAERARRELTSAEAAVASTRTRRQFLEDSLARLEARVKPAEAELPEAQREAAACAQAASAAAAAASRVARLRAEVDGLDALGPVPAGGLRRLGDVVLARAGYEAALSAVLGPLVDAGAAPDADAARAAAVSAGEQATVLYPAAGVEALEGSLLQHVDVEPGFEELALRLLGRLVVGRDVTMEGVFHQPGLVRAGNDPRVRLAARRRRLGVEVASLEPLAAGVSTEEERRQRADARLAELRSAASQRPQIDETMRQLEAARRAESDEQARLPELERALAAAEAAAVRLARAVEQNERLLTEHRAEVRRLELERARWRERHQDLRRQLAAVDRDLETIAQARANRRRRAEEAQAHADAVTAALPGLREAVATAQARLEEAERESPEEEAELAGAARLLVTAEEARVDARLKVSTLEGSLGLIRREAELAAARMEELRSRMPAGLAPEEVPGGKAREREMRQLERRLEEIGPTNALAEAECGELEQRYGNLVSQLDDIAAARTDLEELVRRLREEEEGRYEAVFGAVAANFLEYFRELTAGGGATLKHSAGDEGPRTGVEILVQPPRKRMQNVTLLSSGERALTALALVLALQAINPAPFTILDEVDAALDDANVVRFGEMIQRLGRERQLMVITHNHLTMASASALYGVHLDESGSSHLVSVRLQDVQPAVSQAGGRLSQEPSASPTADAARTA